MGLDVWGGDGVTSRLRVLSAPLLWLLVVFALAGPLVFRSGTHHPAVPTGTGTHAHAGMAAAGTATEAPNSDSGRDTGDSPGVLALPPKIHLVVNRTGTGTAPSAPVLALLPAPVDRTDAGIRIATDRAGTAPAAAPPANSRWGRAPPRAFA